MKSRDDRLPIANHLADDLHKRLNDLENLYSTVKNFSCISMIELICFLRSHKVQIVEI